MMDSLLNRRPWLLGTALPLLVVGVVACSGADGDMADVTDVDVVLTSTDEVEAGAPDGPTDPSRPDWRELAAAAEGAAVFLLDGEAIDGATALALGEDELAQVEVTRRIDGDEDHIEVRLLTDEGVAAGGSTPMDDVRVTMDDFDGLLVVDGQIRDAAELQSIAPEQIQEMRVLKGEGATEKYDDPRASEGVIEITTRGS